MSNLQILIIQKNGSITINDQEIIQDDIPKKMKELAELDKDILIRLNSSDNYKTIGKVLYGLTRAGMDGQRILLELTDGSSVSITELPNSVELQAKVFPK